MASVQVRGISCKAVNGYPQACLNYQSVVSNYPEYATITCPWRKPAKDPSRPVLEDFDAQRNRAEWDPVIKAPNGCSPDESPPAIMAEVNDNWEHLTSLANKFPQIERYMSNKPHQAKGQMVRYLDFVENRNAGKIFDKCRQPPRWDVGHTSTITQNTEGVETEWIVTRVDMTRTAFTLDFDGLAGYTDYGLEDNVCVPTFNGKKHPGYALFNEDKWFDTHAEEKKLQDVYKKGPEAIPAGSTKRWVEDVGLVVAGANATRVATEEEIREHMGFDACSGAGCARELRALRQVVAVMKDQASLRECETGNTPCPPEGLIAVSTPTGDTSTTAAVEAHGWHKSGGKASLPRETGSTEASE